MGRAISDLRGRLEEGDAVLVTVITDGYENASCEYSGADIKAMVEELSKKGWLFTYIGANSAMDFDATAEGTADMFVKEQQARGRWFQKRMQQPSKTDMSDDCDFFD